MSASHAEPAGTAVTPEQIFEIFKEGLQRSVAASDFDTHFDLGIAYREMGLGVDALREWAVVLAGQAPSSIQRESLRMIFSPVWIGADGVEQLKALLFAV